MRGIFCLLMLIITKTFSIIKLNASRIVIVRGLNGMRCRRILSIIVSSGSYAFATYSKTLCEVINSMYLCLRIRKFLTLNIQRIYSKIPIFSYFIKQCSKIGIRRNQRNIYCNCSGNRCI